MPASAHSRASKEARTIFFPEDVSGMMVKAERKLEKKCPRSSESLSGLNIY